MTETYSPASLGRRPQKFDNPWIARKSPRGQISCPESPLLINDAATRRPNFSKFLFGRFGRFQCLESAKNLEKRFLSRGHRSTTSTRFVSLNYNRGQAFAEEIVGGRD